MEDGNRRKAYRDQLEKEAYQRKLFYDRNPGGTYGEPSVEPPWYIQKYKQGSENEDEGNKENFSSI
jgi:hypothetical protein